MKTTLSISQSIEKQFKQACKEQAVNYTCVKEEYYRNETDIYTDYEVEITGFNDLWFLGFAVGLNRGHEIHVEANLKQY